MVLLVDVAALVAKSRASHIIARALVSGVWETLLVAVKVLGKRNSGGGKADAPQVV